MFRTRSPWALLKQWDIQAILAVVAVDLSLTIRGISTGQGSELNPFYIPFTDSMELMVIGAVLYGVILCTCSLVLAGSLRNILASIVFGMHVVGMMTWSFLVLPGFHDMLNLFWYMLAGTGATALFYFLETLPHPWRTRKSAQDDGG